MFRCVPSPESTPRRFYLTPKLDYSLQKRHRNSQKNLMASHSIISCSYLIGNLMVHPYLLFGIVTNNNNIIKLFCWLSLKWNAMTGMFCSTLSFQKCTLKIQKKQSPLWTRFFNNFLILFFSFFLNLRQIRYMGIFRTRFYGMFYIVASLFSLPDIGSGMALKILLIDIYISYKWINKIFFYTSAIDISTIQRKQNVFD